MFVKSVNMKVKGILGLHRFGTELTCVYKGVREVYPFNMVQQVVLLSIRLSTESTSEHCTRAHLTAGYIAHNVFLQHTPVISWTIDKVRDSNKKDPLGLRLCLSESGKRLSIFLKCTCMYRNLESLFSGFWQGKSWHWKSGHRKGGKSEAREARKIWEGQRLWLLLFVGCVHVNWQRILGRQCLGTVGTVVSERVGKVDPLNVVQQVVLLCGRLSTEGAPENHTGAHFVARHLSRDEFLQHTPVISWTDSIISGCPMIYLFDGLPSISRSPFRCKVECSV